MSRLAVCLVALAAVRSHAQAAEAPRPRAKQPVAASTARPLPAKAATPAPARPPVRMVCGQPLAPTAFWVLGCVAAGASGTPFVVTQLKDWYAKLDKPSWNPPNGVFAPTWTFLYATLGVAAARAARLAGPFPNKPIGLFLGAFAANVLWPPIFFGLHKLWLGAFWNVLVLASGVATAASFWPVSRGAALLLGPYLGWVTFATALNFDIARRNTGAPPAPVAK